MIGKIVVIDKESDLKKYGYDNLKSVPLAREVKKEGPLSESDMALMGEQVYTLKGCGACHKTDGTSQIAPAWNGLYGKEENVRESGKITSIKVDDDYIRESIKTPQKKIVVGFENTPMPTLPMTDEEMNQVMAYIKSLK
jgi:cytochrome c oxidase subunit 2